MPFDLRTDSAAIRFIVLEDKKLLNFFSSGFKKSDFKYLKLIVNKSYESVWVVKKKGSGQIYLLKEVSKIE